eukprot:scaffold1307_cov200-Pinguiococcus_pyrenoidosus.AAC.92
MLLDDALRLLPSMACVRGIRRNGRLHSRSRRTHLTLGGTLCARTAFDGLLRQGESANPERLPPLKKCSISKEIVLNVLIHNEERGEYERNRSEAGLRRFSRISHRITPSDDDDDAFVQIMLHLLFCACRQQLFYLLTLPLEAFLPPPLISRVGFAL